MRHKPFDVSIRGDKFEFDIGGDVIFDALLHGGKELRHLRRIVKSVKDFNELYLEIAKEEVTDDPVASQKIDK